MKRIALAAELRNNIGSKDAKQIRANNNVPCVLYGGEESIHFSLNGVALDKCVFTPEVYLYEIEVSGKKHLASMKEVQFHPVTDRPIHVDFYELSEDKEAQVAIPVKLLGTPLGVRNGGRLSQVYNKVTIKGLPAKLPEYLEVNVDEVRIGQSIRIGELETEGLEILEDPNNVLMAVKMAREVIEEEPEEEEGEEGEGGEEGEAAAEGGEKTAEASGEQKKEEGSKD